MQLHYFALDGNYGSADGMEVFDTSKWTEADWQEIDEETDYYRVELARTIALKYATPSTEDN